MMLPSDQAKPHASHLTLEPRFSMTLSKVKLFAAALPDNGGLLRQIERRICPNKILCRLGKLWRVYDLVFCNFGPFLG